MPAIAQVVQARELADRCRRVSLGVDRDRDEFHLRRVGGKRPLRGSELARGEGTHVGTARVQERERDGAPPQRRQREALAAHAVGEREIRRQVLLELSTEEAILTARRDHERADQREHEGADHRSSIWPIIATMPPFAVSAGYVLLIALWGSTWAAIKVGVEAVPPFVFAFERAVAVSTVLIGLSLALRHPFPRDRRVIVSAIVVGIVNTGSSWAIIFWSEQYVPSGLVSVFGASSPIWTALLAHFLIRGDQLSPTKVVGLLLGLAGIGVLVGAPDTSGRPEALTASVLLAVMPVTWAVGSILQARELRQGSPLPLVAIGTTAGSVFLLPFAAAQAGQAATWSVGAALVVVAVALNAVAGGGSRSETASVASPAD